MRISILCSSTDHPIFSYLKKWTKEKSGEYYIELVNTIDELSGGNLLFLISCNELVDSSIRSLYESTLVIHASDLPKGRGWSPHIWQLLEGEQMITVTLLEAEDKIDSGRIWSQKQIFIENHELYDEINFKLFQCELELMDIAIKNISSIQPYPQPDESASYYSKRKPQDSEVDPTKSLIDSFDLMRVSDPERFPAFFYLHGKKYFIKIEKAKD